MKASYYTFVFRFAADVMLYNTKSGASVLLEDFDKRYNFLFKNENFALDLSDPLFTLLIENGFIVNNEVDELKLLQRIHREHVGELGSLDLTILPTSRCNFKCPYCFLYESENDYMTVEDYDNLYIFICNHFKENKSERKTLFINWFGGEPTLCHSDIVLFMERINNYAKPLGIYVQSSITTNGFLLTDFVFDKLLAAGIIDYQVTLDGDAKNHDSLRCLHDGSPTYETIIANLLDIKNNHSTSKYEMRIRCNFTKSSIRSMFRFLDEFKERFADDPRWWIYFRPVYNYETKENHIGSMANDLYTLEEGIEVQNQFAIEVLRGKPAKRRMFDPLPSPTKSWCNSDKLNHLIIGPGCSLYMCDTLTGADHIIGKISEGRILQNENYNLWNYDVFSDKRTEKCVLCKLLPICYGSCRRNRIKGNAQCYWSEEIIYNAMKKVYINKKNERRRR